MHFLAVALVYAAADSSKDSDTMLTGEVKKALPYHLKQACAQENYKSISIILTLFGSQSNSPTLHKTFLHQQINV